jgi:glyoxylase-like metal-dependent hydrolase (beta-lactamase superfamily II)
MQRIHRFQASLFPVNAYIVESSDACVVVDSTLGVSDGMALRARVEALGKPLAAVVVTHAHPDHYGAITSLVEGLDVPIVSVAGVADVIRRDDEAKERILRPMFGAEWPVRRTFPNTVVRDGEQVRLGGTTFRVVDLGPGESPHDSMWQLTDEGRVTGAFCGDLAYAHMHGFLADGYHEAWLRNIARVRGLLDPDTTLYVGHGEPGPAHALLDWQEGYIRTYLDAVRRNATSGAGAKLDDATLTERVTTAMRGYLPSDDLLFLMQLSVAATAVEMRGTTDV